MAHIINDRQDLGDRGGYPNGQNNMYGGYRSPDEDPAIINPDELATFPKQVQTGGYHHHDTLHVNHKRTPVMDGRNIVRTDNHPDKHGFM